MYYTPLDQFEIRDFITVDIPILFNMHLSITSINLYLFLALTIIMTLNIYINKYSLSFIYVSWKIIAESIYDTMFNVSVSQISEKKGQLYFPMIFTLFILILINNIIGLIPYNFSTTSHFLLAFSWSFSIVIGTVFLGVSIHKLKYLSLFVPQGCPLPLLPLLVLIEIISFIARNISLGLRLAANVLAGHMLLFILSGFTFKIFKLSYYSLLGVLPLIFIIAFSYLELAIAFIQAQVFVVLSAGYIKDSLYLH
jgi:F-type H+-transporting ATPase subunit a